MPFMIIVKATNDSEAGIMPEEGKILVRQVFELADFGESDGGERFRTIGVGTGK
jgi:hypothetical protein